MLCLCFVWQKGIIFKSLHISSLHISLSFALSFLHQWNARCHAKSRVLGCYLSVCYPSIKIALLNELTWLPCQFPTHGICRLYAIVELIPMKIFFVPLRKCRERGTGKKNFYISDVFISLLKLNSSIKLSLIYLHKFIWTWIHAVQSSSRRIWKSIIWMVFNKQLLDEVEHDVMNYQNRGLYYRLRQIIQTQGFW